MFQSFIVIDDFYQNPDEVRGVALEKCTFNEAGRGIYPGRNSKEFVMPPNADQMFSQILREPVVGRRDIAHGKMRIALKGDERIAKVHVDDGCSWAGIVYLTRDEDIPAGSGEQGAGTQFFRHKATGSDRAPLTDREAQEKFGVPTAVEALKKVIGQDGRDMSKWDHVLTLPMKYNRCVLFRPWFWHTSGIEFGDRVENGRLVQLLFFKPPQGAKVQTVPVAAR